MDKNTRILVGEVSVGILLFTMAAMLVALVVYPEKSVFAGLLLGMVIAFLMFLSMAQVLERSMRTGEPAAVQRRTIISAVIRYLILIVILAVVLVYWREQVNVIALVIGVFGLKVGAYIQPVLHRFLSRRKNAG